MSGHSAEKGPPVVTMRHVRWAAQECLWQQSGETSVAWMLEGWEYAARLGDWYSPVLNDILTLGRVVEPRHNMGGLRRVDVRVGYSVKMPHANIPAALDQWLVALPELDPTEAFRQYEEIHPFRDGNGRTGSILFNWLSKTLHAPIHPPNLWDDSRRDWAGYPDPDKAEPRRVFPPEKGEL